MLYLLYTHEKRGTSMSYIETYRLTNKKGEDKIVVWERTKAGRIRKEHDPEYYYYVEDPNGKDVSIFGKRLSKRTANSWWDLQGIRKISKNLYESDIDPEIKCLGKHYYGKEPPELHVTFFDIEVDYDPEIGHASFENAYAPISAISIQHYWSNESIVFAVPPPGWDKGTLDKSLSDLAEIRLCRDERDLLFQFLDEIEDSDVICGWNSDVFDIPYIYARLGKRGSPKYVSDLRKRLCFPESGEPKTRIRDVYGQPVTFIDLIGRIRTDYMELFIKYEMDKRPSYKLESISEEILPELPKLPLTKSLYRTYHEDFNYFLRYNIRDCEVLKGFEDKLGYVQLANVMSHMSCAHFKHALGTVSCLDLAIVNFCHYELNVKVPDYSQKPDGSIQGACVLFPQIGMHQGVGSIDITSLYPTTIRSINISPETLIGQFPDRQVAWEEICKESEVELEFNLDKGESETRTANQWKQVLQGHNWAVSAYGTVFDQNKPGVIPTLLTTWFMKRKEYQKLKKDAYEQVQIFENNKREHAKWMTKYTYYDKMQYVYKIKLNSAYGALTNYYFRFFDLRMGESVTGTGRAILKHQCRMVAKLIDGNYDVDFPLYDTVTEALSKGGTAEEALDGPKFNGSFQTPSVIYGDTDSCYFETGAAEAGDAIRLANYVAKQVNASFQPYMQKSFLCISGYDDLVKAGREVVTGRGIFVNKKRYVLHLIDLDGKPVDKIKIMGLDIKKTTMPKHVATVLLGIIEELLRNDDWNAIEQRIVDYKDKLRENTNILDIGLPKGIKGIEDYTEAFKVQGDSTRLPGHVAAAIHYNMMLQKYNDKESPKITSGMKLKVYYLTVKHGKFKSIALPTDIDEIPEWFKEHFAQEIDYDAHILRLIDNPLENIFVAIKKQVPTKQSMLIDSLLIF